jgi:hypothetical protein
MDSSVLRRAVITMQEGKEGVGDEVDAHHLACAEWYGGGGACVLVGGESVFASLGRVQRWWVYREVMYLEWRYGVCVPIEG